MELSHLFSPENSEILKTARQPWWESFTSCLAGRFSLACCPICKSARLSTWMPSRSLGLKCARPHVWVFSHRSAPCALPRVGIPLPKTWRSSQLLPVSHQKTRRLYLQNLQQVTTASEIISAPTVCIWEWLFPFSWDISNWGIHAHPLGEKPLYCEFNLMSLVEVKCLVFFFCTCHASCESSSLTRNLTQGPSNELAKLKPLDRQGIPRGMMSFNMFKNCWLFLL